jgi:hypothetical protein
MVGNTLREIREHIDALRADGGPFYLVCARTGERPVPVADARFDDRSTAAEAARTAAEYRTALRRYDPSLPYRDLIVCEDEWVGSGGSNADDLIAFCHDVAGVFFEALSEHGYGGIERDVFDDYLAAAETVDRDELCLELLRSLVDALSESLPPEDQAALVAYAADRLPAPDPAENPVDASLARLRDVDLIADYAVTATKGPERNWEVTLSEYALAGTNGRLPTLPLVVDLLRRIPDADVTARDARVTDDGWRLTVTAGSEGPPTGLISVDVDADTA